MALLICYSISSNYILFILILYQTQDYSIEYSCASHNYIGIVRKKMFNNTGFNTTIGDLMIYIPFTTVFALLQSQL